MPSVNSSNRIALMLPRLATKPAATTAGWGSEMGIMSRLAAEHAAAHELTAERMDMLEARAEDDRDRIDALRRELRIASFRFEALAQNTEAGPLRALYTRWAREAYETVGNF